MKKRMLVLIAVLAVAVAAICLLCRKTPQVPTIRQDVRGRRAWNFDIISRVLRFSEVKQNV